MGWAFRIVRIAGIDIKVHVTFFLVLLLGAFMIQGQGVAGMIFGVVLVLLLFFCVTLHELGHSAAARFFGVPVREIVLLPLGGVALIARNPDKPLHELIIALAGPLVNLLIALLLLPAVLVTMISGGLEAGLIVGGGLTPNLSGLLLWLFEANIILAVFNMIPAFPLDGGRVLRAVLAMATGEQRATRIASAIGQGVAVLIGVLALMNGNILLAMVAAFIFFGAGQETVASQTRSVLTTLKVGDAYNKHALTLDANDRINKVVDYILTSYQPDFAVIYGGQPIGIVTRNDVMKALAEGQGDYYINGIMQRDIVRVDQGASLDAVRNVMAERNVRVVAVYDGEQYLGLVSLEDIGEAYALATHMRRRADDGQNEAERADTGP
jgi:Zn-dependent protease/predicted transcriptional regulator